MSVAVAETTLTLETVAEATRGQWGGVSRVLAGVSIDSRSVGAGELFVAIRGARFDGHDFVQAAAARGAAAALVSRDVEAPPGLPLLRVADTTRALGDLARHVRLASDLPLVGITGSTGKTTTKEMAAALLGTRGPVLRSEGNLNNYWGLPLSLLRLEQRHTAVVLEMAMSSPGELRHLSDVARPDVAAITNVAPVHLEFFESVDAIADAKAEILEGLRPGGAAVLNRDDPRVRRIGERFAGEVVWFGRDRDCDVSAERWRGTLHGGRFDLRLAGDVFDVALPLPGIHFVSGFLAAAACAHRLGVSGDAIAAAAAGIQAAPHRGRVLRLADGVTLVDDSYNSSPVAVEAMVAALAMAAPARRLAFLGDMLELGTEGPALHRQTGERIAPQLQALVAVGPLAAHLVEGARAAGLGAGALHVFPDSRAAAAAVAELVRPGDAVLVKGSRSLRMEEVVGAILARHAEEGTA